MFDAGIGEFDQNLRLKYAGASHSEIFQKEESKLPNQPQYSPEEAGLYLISVSSVQGSQYKNILGSVYLYY